MQIVNRVTQFTLRKFKRIKKTKWQQKERKSEAQEDSAQVMETSSINCLMSKLFRELGRTVLSVKEELREGPKVSGNVQNVVKFLQEGHFISSDSL